jgi:hypothetical protein
MKNSEEAIERVLAGLRDVEAPDGMERRILAGLEGQRAAEARSGLRRFMPVWLAMAEGRVAARALVCGVALAGVVVLALAIPAMRRAGRVPEHSEIVGGHVKVVPRTPSVIATGDGKRSSRVSSGRSATTTNAPGAKPVSEADSDESIAMSEIQAASFPAPPMPLTEQEKLLLRIARKVNPVEMAMLDPKARAMQDAEEKAEFQRFFGQTARQPLPAQLPPGQSATEQSPQGLTTAEQGVPNPTTMEQVAPEQPSLDQPMPDQPTKDQPTQEQSKPQNIGPDQPTTQQLTARPIRTGENE